MLQKINLRKQDGIFQKRKTMAQIEILNIQNHRINKESWPFIHNSFNGSKTYKFESQRTYSFLSVVFHYAWSNNALFAIWKRAILYQQRLIVYE